MPRPSRRKKGAHVGEGDESEKETEVAAAQERCKVLDIVMAYSYGGAA